MAARRRRSRGEYLAWEENPDWPAGYQQRVTVCFREVRTRLASGHRRVRRYGSRVYLGPRGTWTGPIPLPFKHRQQPW